jgi:nitrate reductase gamma subunit
MDSGGRRAKHIQAEHIQAEYPDGGAAMDASTAPARRPAMAAAPIGFKLHGLAAFFLFALWPFTRLVHVFSAPLGYLTRLYIVYRSRDYGLGSRPPRRGWERVR